MTIGRVTERSGDIVSTLARVIVGKADVLERILAGILANGHVLIEDYPGLAKTLIARLFAQALNLSFKRLQCTPDLLPADVTGSFLFDQRQARFEFRPGPVFTHLLLADEINRATPKTQAALLEAMQEAQVTVEGETFRLEPPFLVIATQNPIELEGTYPLPEAQLDRFLMRVSVGYPSADEERQILERRRQRRQDETQVPAVVSRDEVLAMQRTLEDVFVSDAVERYVVDLVQATRTDHRVALGASPRGALALLKLARAWAVLRGRDFVTPDDVKAMAGSALSHRLILQPELWVSKLSAAQVVNDRAPGKYHILIDFTDQPVSSSFLVVHTDFAKKRPDVVRKLIRRILESYRQGIRDPRFWVRERGQAFKELDDAKLEAQLRALVKIFDANGGLDRMRGAGAVDNLTFQVATGNLSGPVTKWKPETFFDTAPLQSVLEEIGQP